MSENFIVSICVVTYNHEKFIRECIESILSQETNFDFEVIIGDDASSDRTPVIIKEYISVSQPNFTFLEHVNNLGPTANYLSVHNVAKGKYVCHCDGDDYWFPGKLQKMVDAIEQDENCSLVWHRMLVLNEKGQTAVGMPVKPISSFIPHTKLYIEDLAKYYGITGCHSGSIYRRSCKNYDEVKIGLDYYFTLSLCENGHYAMYIDEPLGCYRFFASEKTVTRDSQAVAVGKAKLFLIESFLAKRPDLSKQFAAQIVFEILLRTYLKQPLKLDFLKILYKCRTFPKFSDIRLIIRIFMANRNSALVRQFNKNSKENQLGK